MSETTLTTEDVKTGLATLMADTVAGRITPATAKREAKRLYDEGRHALTISTQGPPKSPGSECRRLRAREPG